MFCPDNWKPQLARLDQSGYINAWMGRNIKSWIQVGRATPFFTACSTQLIWVYYNVIHCVRLVSSSVFMHGRRLICWSPPCYMEWRHREWVQSCGTTTSSISQSGTAWTRKTGPPTEETTAWPKYAPNFAVHAHTHTVDVKDLRT